METEVKRTMHDKCAAIVLLTTLLGSACTEGPTKVKLPYGVRVVSSPSGDTIEALPTQPIVVTLADSSGAPLAGRLVRFEGLRGANVDIYDSNVGQPAVASIGSTAFRRIVYDTTDANGYASVMVKLGSAAGATSVFIRDPEFGTEVIANIPVAVGAAASITVDPADSALYINRNYQLRATLRDRGGNARTGPPISFSVAAGPVSVGNTTGIVTGNAFGQAIVVAQSLTFQDTAFVSVVPSGTVAAGSFTYPPVVDLVDLDGSHRQRLTGEADNGFTTGFGFGWSPDGRELAIGRGDSVYVVSPGTPGRRVLARGQVNLGARFSPDGRWVYYAGSQSGLRRVRSDGSVSESIDPPNRFFTNIARPSPSPDGSLLLYMYFSNCSGISAVKILDLATVTNRLFNGSDYLLCANYATWSPVGNLVAYSSDSEIGVVNADGSGRRVLSAERIYPAFPEFSSDGRWILVFPLFGAPLLFDTQSNLRIPVPTLLGYGAAAWRP